MERLKHPGKFEDPKRYFGDDIELATVDLLGGVTQAARLRLWAYDKSGDTIQLDEVRRIQSVFYGRLTILRSTGFTPKGKCTDESLQRFEEFKALDWTRTSDLDQVESYLYSLMPSSETAIEPDR